MVPTPADLEDPDPSHGTFGAPGPAAFYKLDKLRPTVTGQRLVDI